MTHSFISLLVLFEELDDFIKLTIEGLDLLIDFGRFFVQGRHRTHLIISDFLRDLLSLSNKLLTHLLVELKELTLQPTDRAFNLASLFINLGLDQVQVSPFVELLVEE